jgi:hypothetical protein
MSEYCVGAVVVSGSSGANDLMTSSKGERKSSIYDTPVCQHKNPSYGERYTIPDLDRMRIPA